MRPIESPTSEMNLPFGPEQPGTRGAFCNKPSSLGIVLPQLGPKLTSAPRPTVVDTTPTCRFGRPSGLLSSLVTSIGKFCANNICLSEVDAELSITNNTS